MPKRKNIFRGLNLNHYRIFTKLGLDYGLDNPQTEVGEILDKKFDRIDRGNFRQATRYLIEQLKKRKE